jgi:tRNA-specific 2-thiouridylase
MANGFLTSVWSATKNHLRIEISRDYKIPVLVYQAGIFVVKIIIFIYSLFNMKLANNKKVFVAMSGGVDSSVAALLLKKQGYNVVGVFMKYWMDRLALPVGRDLGENRCCSVEARQDAMRVCAALKIPFLTWDFQKEFKKAVVDDFVSGYKKGITPNPCVVCNKKIKLGMFLEKALECGADYVATGHYVRLQRKFPISNFSRRKVGIPTSLSENKNGAIENCKLKIARDSAKDQSYFLWTLTQKQLKHCLFPIGDYTKEEVREIAKKTKLPVALKKDSQEVCFVHDADLRGFLKTQINTDTGVIIDLKTSKKLGEHEGVEFYTIGQRVPVGGTGPYYVTSKNLKKNQLIVARKNDKSLYSKEVIVKDVNFINPRLSSLIHANSGMIINVRTRYRQPLVSARIKNQELRIKDSRTIRDLKFMILKFNQPVKFVASGQSAVFYSIKGEVLGGGVIA